MGGCCAKPRPWFDDENVTEVVSVALEAARSSSPCKAARPFYLVHSAGREAQKNALALQRSARAAQAAGLSPFHTCGLCRFALFDLSARLVGQPCAIALVLTLEDFELLQQWLDDLDPDALPLARAHVALYLLYPEDCTETVAPEDFARAVRALGGELLCVACNEEPLGAFSDLLLDKFRAALAQTLNPLFYSSTLGAPQ